MNRSFDRLKLVNTYGAFGSVGDTRNEVSLLLSYSISSYLSYYMLLLLLFLFIYIYIYLFLYIDFQFILLLIVFQVIIMGTNSTNPNDKDAIWKGISPSFSMFSFSSSPLFFFYLSFFSIIPKQTNT